MPGAMQGERHGKQLWHDLLLERHTVDTVEIPEHEHREFCLHLQLRGDPKLEWWCEGRNEIETTGPGSMILLAPGTRDRLRWQGASDRLILSLHPDLLHRTTEELGSKIKMEFVNQWSLRDGAVQHLMMEMSRESDEGWPLGGLYADLLALNLATLLLRRHAATPLVVRPVKSGLSMPKLRQAMEYITENLHRDLRLEEMAGELQMSPFHFARQFRGSLKQSPYQYLLEQRIGRAKVLLKRHGLTVQEIAYETGWNSPVNFVRAFQQRVGQTPGAWRLSSFI